MVRPGKIIENKLPLLMKENKIKNYTELSILTKIDLKKIESFADNKIDFKLAEQLCSFFGCKTDKLLGCINEDIDYNFHLQYNLKHNGVVYFLKADNGLVKIGRTSNLQQRKTLLEQTEKVKTELIHHIATFDTPTLEKIFHDMFSDKNVHGEWFDLEDEDIQRITKL